MTILLDDRYHRKGIYTRRNRSAMFNVCNAGCSLRDQSLSTPKPIFCVALFLNNTKCWNGTFRNKNLANRVSCSFTAHSISVLLDSEWKAATSTWLNLPAVRCHHFSVRPHRMWYIRIISIVYMNFLTKCDVRALLELAKYQWFLQLITFPHIVCVFFLIIYCSESRTI